MIICPLKWDVLYPVSINEVVDLYEEWIETKRIIFLKKLITKIVLDGSKEIHIKSFVNEIKLSKGPLHILNPTPLPNILLGNFCKVCQPQNRNKDRLRSHGYQSHWVGTTVRRAVIQRSGAGNSLAYLRYNIHKICIHTLYINKLHIFLKF